MAWLLVTWTRFLLEYDVIILALVGMWIVIFMIIFIRSIAETNRFSSNSKMST